MFHHRNEDQPLQNIQHPSNNSIRSCILIFRCQSIWMMYRFIWFHLLAIHITDSHPWGSLRSKPVHAHARLHTLKRSIHQVIQVVRIPQKSPWKGLFGRYFNNESQKKRHIWYKIHQIHVWCLVDYFGKLSCHHVTAVTSGAQTLGSVESPPRWAHVQFELLKIYRTLQFKDTSTNINKYQHVSTLDDAWCIQKVIWNWIQTKYSTVLESISCWSWTLKVVQKPWSFGTLPTLPLTPLSTETEIFQKPLFLSLDKESGTFNRLFLCFGTSAFKAEQSATASAVCPQSGIGIDGIDIRAHFGKY